MKDKDAQLIWEAFEKDDRGVHGDRQGADDNKYPDIEGMVSRALRDRQKEYPDAKIDDLFGAVIEDLVSQFESDEQYDPEDTQDIVSTLLSLWPHDFDGSDQHDGSDLPEPPTGRTVGDLIEQLTNNFEDHEQVEFVYHDKNGDTRRFNLEAIEHEGLGEGNVHFVLKI